MSDELDEAVRLLSTRFSVSEPKGDSSGSSQDMSESALDEIAGVMTGAAAKKEADERFKFLEDIGGGDYEKGRLVALRLIEEDPEQFAKGLAWVKEMEDLCLTTP